MFFDFLYYRQVVAYTWSQKQWPGRNNALFKLLVVTPLLTSVHTLCFLLDYLFFPALWRQQINKPVFIVGHARSGTTLMHRLMAADGERFSYFYFWETIVPALTEKAVIRAIGWLDRTLFSNTLQKRLETWDEKTYGPTRHIHKQGLWIPEEDQFVMRAAFVTQQWALDLPLMDKIDLFHIDKLPEKRKKRWMHHYSECVKRQLLANGGDKTHLSKNPMMSGWVNAILETFPDARIVVMVRDPVQCIPSTLRLMEGSWKRNKWQKAQYGPALEALAQISFDSYKLPVKALKKHPHTPHCFVDYRDITAAPKQTVETVYAALQIPLSDEHKNHLLDQEKKEKKHSSHFRYDIEDYSVTRAQIETELGEFYDRYQWPREREQQTPRCEGAAQ